MSSVVALIGRPNVGKSTLFNVLTKTRNALVADFSGLTRDRIYGLAHWGESSMIVIDTGGMEEAAALEGLSCGVAQQTFAAIEEADILIFLVDGRVGVTANDQLIARRLQRVSKPVILAVNKIESLESSSAVADFYSLGLGNHIVPIAAAHGLGVPALMQLVSKMLTPPTAILDSSVNELATESTRGERIKIALVGRPNVGKSMLTNRLLGSERMVVYDLPGTTRDSVASSIERKGVPYEIVDTAGVRRRSKVDETVEKFSVIKSLQAVDQAHVALLVIDGQQNLVDQDLSLLSFILNSGRALVIVVNKWDGVSEQLKAAVKGTLERRLPFATFARIHFISALHGSGVGALWSSVKEAYDSANRRFTPALLTKLTLAAQKEHLPPMVQGRRVKLKYAHIGGYNPPTIVIHGNQIDHLPDSYRRYLMGYYRNSLKIMGTPILLQLKGSENPYAGKRNVLTPSQLRKRQRLVRHRKKRS